MCILESIYLSAKHISALTKYKGLWWVLGSALRDVASVLIEQPLQNSALYRCQEQSAFSAWNVPSSAAHLNPDNPILLLASFSPSLNVTSTKRSLLVTFSKMKLPIHSLFSYSAL